MVYRKKSSSENMAGFLLLMVQKSGIRSPVEGKVIYPINLLFFIYIPGGAGILPSAVGPRKLYLEVNYYLPSKTNS